MANPRKFSEKIALLNQKEAEGNAEFERIMREVSEVSAKVSQAPRSTNLIATTSAFISRSLPNVNAPINNANNTNNIDHKSDDTSPTTTLAGLLTTGYSNDISKNVNSDSKTASRESRGRSVGGGPMRSRRNIDTSPYSNNNTYLSPPQESSWRRTSSDSAIHQSLTQAQDNNVQSLMLSPRAQKRLSNSQSNSMKNIHQQHQIHQQHSHSQQNMQNALLTQQHMQNMQQQQSHTQHLVMNNLQQDMKSRSVSRLPGIHVYPTAQNDDLLQIPVGTSTGSLPDLTLVHFQQSPISNPLDPQDQLIAVTSSFNTNSSYSMPSTNQTANQLPSITQQMYNPDQYNSPKHFNNNNNSNNHNNNNNNKNSSSQGILIQQGSNQYAQQHQSNPIPIELNPRQQPQQSPLHHQSYPNQISVDKMMSYRSTNAASPANLSMSQGNLSKNYRSSPNGRPSPGSSPICNVPGLSANFDSNSSAPCSPSPQMGNNGQFETYPSVDLYLNPAIQHFEQFSLDWTSLVQSLVDSGCTISAEVKVDSPLPDYITHTSNDQNYSQQISDNYNGIITDSPNRTNQSPNNRHNTPNRPSSRSTCTNNINQATTTTTSSGGMQHTSNGGSGPHSPLGSDSMLSGNNYDSILGNRTILTNSPLDGSLTNGTSGVNDIMLGAGLCNDSNSKLISSSSPALQMMLTTSPSHQPTQLSNAAIPEIVFSDYSSGAIDFSEEPFLELGTTELQMFENNIIDPSIEENFRRDLY